MSAPLQRRTGRASASHHRAFAGGAALAMTAGRIKNDACWTVVINCIMQNRGDDEDGGGDVLWSLQLSYDETNVLYFFRENAKSLCVSFH
jgi:hypothetical protein